MLVTLGIDPGSRRTGYGVVEGDGRRLRYVTCGTIALPGNLSFPQRLGTIYRDLQKVIRGHGPHCMAVEAVFLARNAQSALKLGQARGAAILAGVNAGLPVHEYTALQVKQAVVGYGKAGKDQIQEMMRYLFGLRSALKPDAADALAVAVCHANTAFVRDRWAGKAAP